MSGKSTTKIAAYPLYVRDLWADTATLSLEEAGAYRLLLEYQWLQGSIPATSRERANFLRISVQRATRLWTSLAHYFPADPDGLLRNRRLERERAKVLERIAKANQAASGRWHPSIPQAPSGYPPSTPSPPNLTAVKFKRQLSEKSLPILNVGLTTTPPPVAVPPSAQTPTSEPVGSNEVSRSAASPEHPPSIAQASSEHAPSIAQVSPEDPPSICLDDAITYHVSRIPPSLPPPPPLVRARKTAATATALAGVPDDLTPAHQAAVFGYLHAARNPGALLAELQAIATGQHPPAYAWPVMGQALGEMAAAGVLYTSAALRGFCRRIAQRATERSPPNGETPAERTARIAQDLAGEHAP